MWAGTMVQEDVAAAWRFLLVNWIALALISAALALGVALAGFSIELSGFLFSLDFVALYAGFAHANACACESRP